MANNQLALLKSTLNASSVQEQFKNALKDHKDAFVASIIDLYSNDKSLQECEPNLVIKEALRAATMNLPLNKALGFSYIVVFKNSVRQNDGRFVKVPTPAFIIGYKGLIQLAMRTGQYETINADVVYEGEIGKVDKLTGKISFDGEKKSDKIIGYFCHFQLLNGFAKTLYMTVEEMAHYAKLNSPSISKDLTEEKLVELANKNISKKAVGWEGNFTSMALKTVTRRLLSKYGYLSIQMQDAIANEVEPNESRDEIIAERANKKTVDVDAVEYTEVEETIPSASVEEVEEDPYK